MRAMGTWVGGDDRTAGKKSRKKAKKGNVWVKNCKLYNFA